MASSSGTSNIQHQRSCVSLHPPRAALQASLVLTNVTAPEQKSGACRPNPKLALMRIRPPVRQPPAPRGHRRYRRAGAGEQTLNAARPPPAGEKSSVWRGGGCRGALKAATRRARRRSVGAGDERGQRVGGERGQRGAAQPGLGRGPFHQACESGGPGGNGKGACYVRIANSPDGPRGRGGCARGMCAATPCQAARAAPRG